MRAELPLTVQSVSVSVTEVGQAAADGAVLPLTVQSVSQRGPCRHVVQAAAEVLAELPLTVQSVSVAAPLSAAAAWPGRRRRS